MFFYFWCYMKDYYSREKYRSLYQVKVHSLFYTTQLQESVYFCDELKRNYQFLEPLDTRVIVNYTKILLLLSFLLWQIHISGQYLNCELKNAFIKIFFFSIFMKGMILAKTFNFAFAFPHLHSMCVLKLGFV